MGLRGNLIGFLSGLGLIGFLTVCHSCSAPVVQDAAVPHAAPPSVSVERTVVQAEALRGLVCGKERCGDGTDHPGTVCCAPQGSDLNYYLCVTPYDCMSAGPEEALFDAQCTSAKDCIEGQACQAVFNEQVPIPQFRCVEKEAAMEVSVDMRLCAEDSECGEICPEGIPGTCNGAFKNLRACACKAPNQAQFEGCKSDSYLDACSLPNGDKGNCFGSECWSSAECVSKLPVPEDGKGVCQELRDMNCDGDSDCLLEKSMLKQECIAETKLPHAELLTNCGHYRALYELTKPEETYDN